MKRMRPLVLIADIAFTENRFPVRRTVGVRPFSPAPGAAGDLVVADADLVGEQHLAALGLRLSVDLRPGLLVPDADGFRVLLDGPLVRALERQAPSAQVLAHALLGQPDPVQLRDQVSHSGPDPELARKTHITRRWSKTACRTACCPPSPRI